MADLRFTIDVNRAGGRAPQAFAAVAAALSRHEVDHALTHAHRAEASWLLHRRVDPIGVSGVARYSAGAGAGGRRDRTCPAGADSA